MSDDGVLAQARTLDTCVVSDALDQLGLPGVIDGLVRVVTRERFVGRADTVLLGPATPDATGPHLATSAVDRAGPDTVLVVANDGRAGSAAWGGLLSLGATARGVVGVVVDGRCRDVDEAEVLRLPIWARSATPVTARGRAVEVASGVPVTIAGVRVEPGDLVLADGSGLVVVPRATEAEVVARALRLVAREAAIAERVRVGDPMTVAMGASYEHLLEER